MARVGFQVVDMRKVDRKLRQLEQVARLEIILHELGEASELIVEAAKARVPFARYRAGVQVLNRIRQADGVKVEVGIPGGRTDWFDALFFERGVGPRYQKTTGRHTGSLRARPFLGPAFNSQKGRVLEAFQMRMRRRIMALSEGA